MNLYLIILNNLIIPVSKTAGLKLCEIWRID